MLYYVLVVYYHCPTDINTEIKRVIFYFSICKLKECKLRRGVNWQAVFKPKTHKKQVQNKAWVCMRSNFTN